MDLESSPCGIPYTVDLTQWQQVSKRTGFCRCVRRVPRTAQYSTASEPCFVITRSLASSKHSVRAPAPLSPTTAKPKPEKRSLLSRLTRKKRRTSKKMGCVSSSSAQCCGDDLIPLRPGKLLSRPVQICSGYVFCVLDFCPDSDGSNQKLSFFFF